MKHTPDRTRVDEDAVALTVVSPDGRTVTVAADEPLTPLIEAAEASGLLTSELDAERGQA